MSFLNNFQEFYKTLSTFSVFLRYPKTFGVNNGKIQSVGKIYKEIVSKELPTNKSTIIII